VVTPERRILSKVADIRKDFLRGSLQFLGFLQKFFVQILLVLLSDTFVTFYTIRVKNGLVPGNPTLYLEHDDWG
jgi:hypothetical protein